MSGKRETMAVLRSQLLAAEAEIARLKPDADKHAEDPDVIAEAFKEACRRIVLAEDFGDTSAMTTNDYGRQLRVLGSLLESLGGAKEIGANLLMVRLQVTP